VDDGELENSRVIYTLVKRHRGKARIIWIIQNEAVKTSNCSQKPDIAVAFLKEYKLFGFSSGFTGGNLWLKPYYLN